jgi:hypothetical protein
VDGSSSSSAADAAQASAEKSSIGVSRNSSRCEVSVAYPHWPQSGSMASGERCRLRTEQGSRSPAPSPQHPEAGRPLERRRWIARDEKPPDVQPGSREIEAIVAADRIPDPSADGTARRLPLSPTFGQWG